MSEIAAQGSEAWRLARCAKITASRVVDVMGSSGARTKYLRELVFERLTGIPVHETKAKSMAWGSEIETFAREAYELESGLLVRQVGFVTHPKYPFVGYSADGYAGDRGLVEIKSPFDEAVHVGTWLDGMPKDHKYQVMTGLWCTGKEFLDFCSYDPRIADPFKLYVQRIDRDENFISKLAAAVIEFNDEVDDTIKRLREKAS